MLDAAEYQGYRLPELFGGLDRDEVPFPVSYPSSCSPQAWAAAAPLLFLRTLLRLDPWVPHGKVWLDPVLPERIGYLRVDRIPLAGSPRVGRGARRRRQDRGPAARDRGHALTPPPAHRRRPSRGGLDHGPHRHSRRRGWRGGARLAVEFAERFALDHQAMDDALFTRLRGSFADEEILDLTICCAVYLGLGRMLTVLGITAEFGPTN